MSVLENVLHHTLPYNITAETAMYILRIVIGVALGLLTVYRREMSCNREYYSEEEENERHFGVGRSSVSRNDSGMSGISSRSADGVGRSVISGGNLHGTHGVSNRIRGCSSSSLLRLDGRRCASQNDLQYEDGSSKSFGGVQKSDEPSRRRDFHQGDNDPTDELLEAMGHSWSGGPLLAVALAVFDHLILTCFLGSLIVLFGRKSEKVNTVNETKNNEARSVVENGAESFCGFDDSADLQPADVSENPLPKVGVDLFAPREMASPEAHNPKVGQKQLHRNDLRVYNVAWNAAVEYFDSISQKIDDGAGKHPSISAGGNEMINANIIKTVKEDDSPFPSRSKSTSYLDNLGNLSPEQSRGMLTKMLAMSHIPQRILNLDITLLPADSQILIFSYLPPKDLLSYTCTSRAGRCLLDDGVSGSRGAHGTAENSIPGSENGVTDNNDANGVALVGEDTALLIWKALWKRDFAWILSDWNIGNEAFMRSLSCFRDQGLVQQVLTSEVSELTGENTSNRKVLRHLTSTILGSDGSGLHDSEGNENGNQNDMAPITQPMSMKEFYFTFSETWINYTIAGCNRSGKCLVGLHGHVFDISNFVDTHPGSTETLLLQAGGDATVFFESMGHSLGARNMAMGMCVVVNGQCVKWDSDDGSISSTRKHPPSSFSTSRLLKPSSSLVQGKRNIHGFLIPKRRSSPRQYGGLHRIRHRLMEEKMVELNKADRWASRSLGPTGLFGGVHLYYDPFCSCWKWWYTDLDFHPIFIESMD